MLAVVAVVVVALGIVIFVASDSNPTVRTSVQKIAGTPEGSTPVSLDTTLYLPETTPAPAVLLAHGFGGLEGLRRRARRGRWPSTATSC